MTETPTYVWVAEHGLYEQRCVGGIFLDLEQAKKSYKTGPDGWEMFDLGDTTEWLNGLDWDDAVRITRHPLNETTP